ncbi:hypothetical protein [Nocardia xishanensis]
MFAENVDRSVNVVANPHQRERPCHTEHADADGDRGESQPPQHGPQQQQNQRNHDQLRAEEVGRRLRGDVTEDLVGTAEGQLDRGVGVGEDLGLDARQDDLPHVVRVPGQRRSATSTRPHPSARAARNSPPDGSPALRCSVSAGRGDDHDGQLAEAGTNSAG